MQFFIRISLIRIMRLGYFSENKKMKLRIMKCSLNTSLVVGLLTIYWGGGGGGGVEPPPHTHLHNLHHSCKIKCVCIYIFAILFNYFCIIEIVKNGFLSVRQNQKWKNDYTWLRFTEAKKMIGQLCCWHAELSELCSNAKFVEGSTKYQLSAIKDLTKYATPHPLQTPTDSAIARGLHQMCDNDHGTITKFHEVAFYITSQGLRASWKNSTA